MNRDVFHRRSRAWRQGTCRCRHSAADGLGSDDWRLTPQDRRHPAIRMAFAVDSGPRLHPAPVNANAPDVQDRSTIRRSAIRRYPDNVVVDVNRRLGRHSSVRVRQSQWISEVGARGAPASHRFATARVLALEPAGQADQRPESARDLLQRPRRDGLGTRRRHPRGCRARHDGWHRVLHARST